MMEITYSAGNENGSIHWAVAEQFSELEGKTFKLSKMEAVEIEKLEDFSNTAKILLSAVAGAVIQHLVDKGIDTETIFNTGSFTIKI